MGPARIAALVVAATATLGCAPQRAARATLPQLQMRAVFDLGCHVSQLQLYHVDRRTKVVAGCGRHLTYQERCDEVGGRRLECSWSVDSPRAGQAWGPASPPAATAAVAPQCPAPPQPRLEGRAIYTDLFQDRDPVQEGARTTPARRPETEGRSIKTELLDPSMLETR